MLIFAFRHWTAVCSDRSLNTWADAFTPAFLNRATRQPTITDFDMTYST